MKYIFYWIICIIVITSCTPQPTATSIVLKSIEAHGGNQVFNSVINFDFRKKHYIATYHHGHYKLERMFTDSTGNVHDVLSNDGFTRTVNDSLVQLNDEWTGKYSRSVNSVVYFFRIPFILKDPAVNLKLLGQVSIKGNDYYKTKASFDQNGGGDDYSDTFIYWINTSTYLVDYLAYSYHTDGGGKRFRVFKNRRTVDGLVTQDYINYEPKDLSIPLANYDTYYQQDGMKVLSQIENENISVKYLE